MKRKEAISTISAGLGVSLTPALLSGLLVSCKKERAITKLFSEENHQLLANLGEVFLPRTKTPGALDVKAQDYVNIYIQKVMTQDQKSHLTQSFLTWKTQFERDHEVKATQADMPMLKQEISKWFDISPDMQKRVALKDISMGKEKLDCYHFLLTHKQLSMVGYYLSEEVGEQHLSYLPVPGPYKSDVPAKQVGNAWSL